MLIKSSGLGMLKKTPRFYLANHYNAPYNVRFQERFRRAWNNEPLIDDPIRSEVKTDTDGFNIGMMKAIEKNQSPMIRKIVNYGDRMNTFFDSFFLPSVFAFGLVYWPYALCFKMCSVLSGGVWFFRAYNKIQEPEAPETYVREMLHTHSKLGQLFKIETTSTLNFEIDYIREFPNIVEFPEYQNSFYQLMNVDGNMIKGEYTFGDVESNAVVKIKFQTMPIRRKVKYLIGEPTFLFDVVAELNHNGQHEEIVLVDRKKTLKKHRPYLIFQ